MNIANKTILITGANRGVGRALVEEALKRGAKKVYAGTRSAWQHPDKRVTPLTLDVTNASQIKQAALEVGSLDLLINNAGIAISDDLSNPDMTDQHMAVNFQGTLKTTQAFLPVLKRSKGAIVNLLSVVSLAPVPFLAGYSVSKAAVASLTQSLRALLASQGVKVHGIFLGPIDTDMAKELPPEVPKTSPEVAAKGIFDGLERDEEDIFPDAMSQTLAEGWRNGAAKALERQFAGLLPKAA